MADYDLVPLEKPGHHTRPVTVAGIHRTKDGHTDVLLHETPHVLRVSHNIKAKSDHLKKLTEAKKNGHPVLVRNHSHTGSVSHVKHMTEKAKEEFNATKLMLPHPCKLQPIDVGAIDPIKFNIVGGKNLKSRALFESSKICPNFKTAKKMFDFCSNQCCQISLKSECKPCIPFQYLEDGCYARAHKMRQIMAEEFGYPSQKAFCYALKRPNYLSVRADLWGACCIEFWFHVAPVVQVRMDANTVVAMIFDPAVFTRPVLMSTWMMGLENGGCYKHAKMSDFSIQPGNAYGPYHDGYLMDPTYKLTDEALIKFSKLQSCGKNAKKVTATRQMSAKKKKKK